MMEWIPCTQKPAVGSLIKWKEPIWAAVGRNKQRNQKPEKIGDQRITGEVTYASRDFVEVMVYKAEKLNSRTSNPLTVKEGDHIRRKLSSVIELGECVMGPWNWPELMEAEVAATNLQK